MINFCFRPLNSLNYYSFIEKLSSEHIQTDQSHSLLAIYFSIQRTKIIAHIHIFICLILLLPNSFA